MLNTILEFLHDPTWIVYAFIVTFIILVLDGYLIPLIKHFANSQTSAPNLAQHEREQFMVQMSWNRSSANFYLLFTVVGTTYIKSFAVTEPNIRIAINLAVAFAICSAVEKFRRALKIKRILKQAIAHG